VAMGDQVIQAQGLGYKHATRPNSAFTGVDLSVSRGERVLLTGDSGAGKSTLLAVLAGLAAHGEDGQIFGTVKVNGTVGMVLQDPEAQTILTRVGDDVAFGAENMGISPEEIWPRVYGALDAVGLDVPLDHNTAHLSGGQKQRLTLAGVLAMGADIILLDEPTANLDPEGRDDVVRAVDAVCRRTGATLIVVEHRPAHWVDFVDTFYHLTAEGLQPSGPDQLPMPPQLPPALEVPANADFALRTHDLQVAFGSPRNIVVPEGFSTVITGKNGVGKTTLVQALAGLVPPVSGIIEYSPRIRNGFTCAGGAVDKQCVRHELRDAPHRPEVPSSNRKSQRNACHSDAYSHDYPIASAQPRLSSPRTLLRPTECAGLYCRRQFARPAQRHHQ
jgi:energy-coupling factor transport system ATP-binding protein